MTETIEGRHIEAKNNIRLMCETLFLENKISKNLFDKICGQLNRIEDNCYSLIMDCEDKEFEIMDSDLNKRIKYTWVITKKIKS